MGSNIFNILFIVGTTALITPVTFASGFVVDTLIAAAVGILLFVCVARTKELRKKAGIVMLLAYICIFYIFFRNDVLLLTKFKISLTVKRCQTLACMLYFKEYFHIYM